MTFLITVLAIVLVAVQNIFKKQSKTPINGRVFSAMLFNTLNSLAGALFFLIYAGFRLEWHAVTIGYSLLFAAAFTGAVVFSCLAILEGSLALSSLAMSYSCMIPTVYGMFTGDELTAWKIGGILLLVLSLFFFNGDRGKDADHDRITPRWALYAFLAFACNGLCSVFQKMYQIKQNNQFTSEFMLLAYTLGGIVTLVVMLACGRKKENRPVLPKMNYLWGLLAGLANAGANLLVITLNQTQQASWLFPMISAGGVVVAFVVALFFYKEKQTPRQIVGFVLGLLSILAIQL